MGYLATMRAVGELRTIEGEVLQKIWRLTLNTIKISDGILPAGIEAGIFIKREIEWQF
jgi:hypothetical protein